MLVIAVAFAFLMRTDLRKVFPIKKPKLLGVVGTLVMWIGGLFAEVVANTVMLYLIPETFQRYSGAERAMEQGISLWISFLIICILPPICEEAVIRGVFQSGIRSRYPNLWVQAIWVGGIFAL